MFTNIFFLILALLLISATPAGTQPWIQSEFSAFAASLFLYLGLCCLIAGQYMFLRPLRKTPGLMQVLVCLELLIYLIVFQYILDAGRIFRLIPYMQNTQTLNVVWELLLYLGGLGVYYCLSYAKPYTYQSTESRPRYAVRQLRFLIPFAVPFILLTVVLDIVSVLLGYANYGTVAETISDILSIVLVLLFLVFLPYFIQIIWKCKPLPEGRLKAGLDAICKRAGFRHAGMKTWSIMHDQLTAGIIGIIPRVRYIMFTDRILRELPQESIEAILAHEIGHSAHRHLLIYPFILSGMIVFTGLFFYFFSEPLTNLLELQNASHPSIWWDFFNPLLVFSIYGLMIYAYFRLVFGYFSRLFERQADLYIFSLGIPASHMIHALKAVAETSGGYDTPNWHHYSIKQRVEFLEACEKDPHLITLHNSKVRKAVVFYFFLLTMATICLVYITMSS